ncbi:hypothetical protein CTAYLR_004102 [Chrysophaeum taylorii]|uniref:F-box/LRR-repeat protein 15-like leucin rich repeat domain-containing protein n=1 Tax=Chrysophaeum taylorii TaxID=2483200 RepID=A0AAD7UER7_9STRA|nr:hypothetical protein CTAYLR_004102 [Chrysophaeum taylorii]
MGVETSALSDEEREVWERERDRIVTDDGRSINLGGSVVFRWWGDELFGKYHVLHKKEVRCVKDAHVKYLLSDQVTRVNLTGCRGITDDALKAIATSCSNLTSLDVSVCGNLTDDALKAIATNCSNLTSLDVSGCGKLTDDALKAIATNCSNLTSLDVSWCRNLTHDALKAIATNCSNLMVLFAKKCEFTSLPVDTGDRLPELQTLSLSENNLTALPRSIVKLTKLLRLDLHRNPLKSPPLKVAEQGLEAIARYFTELDLAGAAVSMELMVVLVGDGGAGKTSLRNAIVGRANPRQAPDDRTLYLDLEKVKIGDLVLSFCDLGGQPAYASAQALFITPSALYLLVVPIDKVDNENFQGGVGRFLEVLQARVPGAIVQLVITKTDLVDNDESAVSECKKWLHDAVDEELNRWRKAVAKNQNVSPDLVQMLKVQDEVLAVTVDDAAVIDAARKSIVELKTLFPSVGQTIPRSWLALWGLFSEIARHGDDNRAVDAIRSDAALPRGIPYSNEQPTKVSPRGAYRRETSLESSWDNIRDDFKGTEDTFADAMKLYQAEGNIVVGEGIVFLQPSLLVNIMKALIDHALEADDATIRSIAKFVETKGLPDQTRPELVESLETYIRCGEVDGGLLLWLWRKLPIDVADYEPVVRMLIDCRILIPLPRDDPEVIAAVVLFRISKTAPPEREQAWPAKLPPDQRQMQVVFEFVTGCPPNLCVYASQRTLTISVILFRVEPGSEAAAWVILCQAKALLEWDRDARFPGAVFDVWVTCPVCVDHGAKSRLGRLMQYQLDRIEMKVDLVGQKIDRNLNFMLGIANDEGNYPPMFCIVPVPEPDNPTLGDFLTAPDRWLNHELMVRFVCEKKLRFVPYVEEEEEEGLEFLVPGKTVAGMLRFWGKYGPIIKISAVFLATAVKVATGTDLKDLVPTSVASKLLPAQATKAVEMIETYDGPEIVEVVDAALQAGGIEHSTISSIQPAAGVEGIEELNPEKRSEFDVR